MKVKNWLKKVAYIGKSQIELDDGRIYYSKYDDSYITRVGMEDHVKHLAERDITEQLSHGTGFSPKSNKWYGWSHRAIFGFTVGSTCKKGDCHYRARNMHEELQAAIDFWSDTDNLNVTAIHKKHGLIQVYWTYSENILNERLRGQVGGAEWRYKKKFGRGEWEAKTMADAKQMAIDFCEGVS